MIVDANRIGRLLADPPDEDVAPVRNWIESGKGRIVYSTGGRFARETGGKARRKFEEYYRAGRARLIAHNDFAEIERDLRNDRRLRSDAPHILALACVSGARLLFSGDPDLILLPGCDAVAASLALHHVADMGAKTALFVRIAQALPPGGVFVNADVTMPEADPQRAADYAAWAAHLVACCITEAQACQHFAQWSDEDTCHPLERELPAMREAGADADCVWRQTLGTVLVGRQLH